MNVNDFLKMPYADVLSMDEKEVRKMASRAASVLNKRATNIRYNRRASALALRKVQNKGKGGRFGLIGSDGKPISGAELADEIARMRIFNDDPASTVRGAKVKLKQIEGEWFGGQPSGTRDELDRLREAENRAYDIASELRSLMDNYYRIVIQRIDSSKDAARGGNVTAVDAIRMLEEIIREGQARLDAGRGHAIKKGMQMKWFRSLRK